MGYRAGPPRSLSLFGVERCSNPEYFPCFFWDWIGCGHIRWRFLRPTRLSEVSPGASNFSVDNGRLLDVAEDCLSAEEVEEIFLGDSVKFLELFERSAVLPL